MVVWIVLTSVFLVIMLTLAVLANTKNKFANSDFGLALTGVCMVGFYACGTVLVLISLYQWILNLIAT